MPYTINVISEREVSVQEDGVTIVQCGSALQANLVINALSLRDRMLKQLAHEFVKTIDDGDSAANMGHQWQGTVLGNGLTKDDSDELWQHVRDILEGSE